MPETSLEDESKAGGIARILDEEFRNSTLKLWTIFFTASWGVHLLMTWTPTLFVLNGLDRADGILALSILAVGGLVGPLGLSYLCTRVELGTLISRMFAISVTLLLVWVLFEPESRQIMYAITLGIGLTLNGGLIGLYAYATQNYPSSIRATGVGWCLGIGRLGSIISPVAAGFFVSLRLGMYQLFLLVLIPAICIAAYLAWVSQYLRRTN